MTTPTKRCYHCKKAKPFADFGKNRRKRLGLSDYCRKCANETGRVSHARRKQGGMILKQKPTKVPEHVCVFVQYKGMSKPICFPHFFAEQKARRTGAYLTDERTRKRTRDNARAKVRG